MKPRKIQYFFREAKSTNMVDYNLINTSYFYLCVDDASSKEGFDPKEMLGKGMRGKVTRFSNLEGNKDFAVKKPCLDDIDLNHMMHECKMWNKVYKDPELQAEVVKNEELNKFRLIMPVLPGVKIEKLSLKDAEEKLQVFIAIGEALSEIHKAGVIHGDVHSGNVLVDIKHDGNKNRYKAYFFDFGEAKEISPNTKDKLAKDIIYFKQMIKGTLNCFAKSLDVIIGTLKLKLALTAESDDALQLIQDILTISNLENLDKTLYQNTILLQQKLQPEKAIMQPSSCLVM